MNESPEDLKKIEVLLDKARSAKATARRLKDYEAAIVAEAEIVRLQAALDPRGPIMNWPEKPSEE